ncbi:MAG: putative Histidine kinase [Patescibacteria group bacterium]|nr:putative Histidine kinase [Patescibacteria group bacterium]
MNDRTLEFEKEVARLRTELAAKSDFLSMIVHQLRTPLTANKWIFKMMIDGDLGAISDEQRKIIMRGLDSNDQMIRMLAEISNANHMSEWKLSFVPTAVNITECIEMAISEFAPEAKTKNVRLSFAKTVPVPPIWADKEKICLVVQNLVENAIKYNRKNGSVTIHAEPIGKNLVVSVTDTGIGIPSDEQKNIFGKFFRAQNAKDFEKGTGLGLFVGKTIVEAHRGEMWFESVPDIGTTFFFSVPLAR